MEKVEKDFIQNIFDSELQNYYLLEKTIFEAMEMYEKTSDEDLKYIIQKNIQFAKNEIFILIEYVAHFFDLDEKKDFEEKIYEKLDNLKEIETKVSSFNK